MTVVGSHNKNHETEQSQETSNSIVAASLERIKHIYINVKERLGLSVPETVAVVDEFLVKTVEVHEQLNDTEAALVEGAMEAVGETGSVGPNPIDTLENDGFDRLVTEAVEDLADHESSLPTGEAVAEVVAEYIEKTAEEVEALPNEDEISQNTAEPEIEKNTEELKPSSKKSLENSYDWYGNGTVREMYEKGSKKPTFNEVFLGYADSKIETLEWIGVLRSEIFPTLSPVEFDSLIGTIMGTLAEQTSEKERKLLLSLFYYERDGNDDLWDYIKKSGISKEDLSGLFQREAFYPLLSLMLDNPKQYKMQLGVIFSEVSLHDIPEEMLNKLKPVASKLGYSLESDHGEWFMCEDAEPRLLESMKEGGYIVMTEKGAPRLLAKFMGKLSALCLEDFTTNGEVFIKGNWYSPVSQELRLLIGETFDIGKGKVEVQGGEWAFMRPVKDLPEIRSEEIIEKAIKLAEAIPEDFGTDEIVYKGTVYKRGAFRRMMKAGTMAL